MKDIGDNYQINELNKDDVKTLIVNETSALIDRFLSEKTMIDGDTIVINKDTSIIGKLISDGIEINDSSTFKTAEIARYEPLHGDNYENAPNLLKHFNLKIKIPERMNTQ